MTSVLNSFPLHLLWKTWYSTAPQSHAGEVAESLEKTETSTWQEFFEAFLYPHPCWECRGMSHLMGRTSLEPKGGEKRIRPDGLGHLSCERLVSALHNKP